MLDFAITRDVSDFYFVNVMMEAAPARHCRMTERGTGYE